MTWVKLDDHFDENPKIAQVGPLGIALWVTGLAYCNRNLTDGFIPTAIALRMLSLEYDDPEERPTTILLGGSRDRRDDGQVGCVPEGYTVPNQLVGAGLWEDAPGGYMVHDYAQFQPLKAQIEAERATKQAAGQAGGIAAAKARATAGGKASGQAKSNPDPDPDPVPSASYEASSSADETLPVAVREMRDTALSKLAPKFANDALQIDEMTAFAHDYPGMLSEYAAALTQCRQNRELPFAGNLRKYMPSPGGVSQPEPKRTPLPMWQPMDGPHPDARPEPGRKVVAP